MNVSRIKRIDNKVEIPSYGPCEYIKLEIGCGAKDARREGYIGIDLIDYGQEILWDVENGIPLPDNSCSHVYASHVMEHLEDFIGVMNECHRVLKPGGELWVIVPHKEHQKALVPSHIRLFDKWTWDFFQYESYANGYGTKVWKDVDIITNERKDMHVKLTPKK